MYICICCTNIIKVEKTYLYHKCQNIYHEKYLESWEQQCILENKAFHCPNCRNILTLSNWNKKLDYDETRKSHANLIDKIIEYKKIINVNYNINQILNIMKII